VFPGALQVSGIICRPPLTTSAGKSLKPACNLRRCEIEIVSEADYVHLKSFHLMIN